MTASDTAKRPPGLRTRNASLNTLSLSAERLITQLEMMTSTELSGRGICSISAFRKSTLLTPALRLFSLAKASVAFGHIETVRFPLGPIRFCSRPFTTVGEMDQAILERLNASVKANDILYFLGDFCMGNPARVVAYRRRIRCQKIFAVPGNHDKRARKLKEDLPGSTIWQRFRSTANRSCFATTPCGSGIEATTDHGTCMDILMGACRMFPTRSPWTWESTHTTSVHGTMTKSPTS